MNFGSFYFGVRTLTWIEFELLHIDLCKFNFMENLVWPLVTYWGCRSRIYGTANKKCVLLIPRVYQNLFQLLKLIKRTFFPLLGRLCIPCAFQLPTVIGGISLLIAALIYFKAALGGESWTTAKAPKRQKTLTDRPPVNPPPRPPPEAVAHKNGADNNGYDPNN